MHPKLFIRLNKSDESSERQQWTIKIFSFSFLKNTTTIIDIIISTITIPFLVKHFGIERIECWNSRNIFEFVLKKVHRLVYSTQSLNKFASNVSISTFSSASAIAIVFYWLFHTQWFIIIAIISVSSSCSMAANPIACITFTIFLASFIQ